MEGHDFGFEDWSDPQHDSFDHDSFDSFDHGGLDDHDLGHGALDDTSLSGDHDLGHGELDHSDPGGGDEQFAQDLPEELGLHHGHDDGDDVYPPQLDVSVTPADGQEWVDPDLLGNHDLDLGPEPPSTTADSADLLSSLHAADGGEGEPSWDALTSSDDPAVRALAHLWSPGSA